VTFDAHSLRHTFSTFLEAADVPGDVADRLLGHAPTSTRARHCTAPKLATLERAILALRFAVPPRLEGLNRPGGEGGGGQDHEIKDERTPESCDRGAT
jgi:hypothetical protein